MTDILQLSKDGAKFYPQTHAQAVLGLPDFSTFEKASDVQTAITSAIKGIAPTDLTNYPTKSDVTTEISTAVSGIKPTDLSNYPTKTDVTTEISSAVSGVSTFEKASDVQTAISSALGKVDVSQTMSMSIRNKLQNMNKEMGS
ncbi:hypothetical protein CPR19081_DFPECDIO_01088 [Companilactobacillus paralimentarius]|uniref:hypothetical protein n=1 Tax=Companilactobacillus paralimentarius TaxID=83526 RepID=UPI00384D58BA